jgi:putative redox protein
MAEVLEVTVHSTNQKLGYTGVAKSNPPIIMDYTPPLGDGKGYMPLELLLMSLAYCSGGTLAYLLKNAGKDISAVKVNAKGIRRDHSPTSFTKIFLAFSLHSKDAEDEDVQKAIRVAEESVCAVWDMLKGNVEIVTEYNIIAS